MKMTQIALAVAAVVATSQSFAAPITPAQITAARQAGTLQQAWISGASASARSIYEGWVGSGAAVGCDVASNTIFTNQGIATGTAVNALTPGAIGNFYAYACTRAGVPSVLYVTTDGGSLNAFAPHTKGTVLARVKFPGAAATGFNQANGTAHTFGCNTTVFNYVDSTNTENNAAVYKACSLVGSALPADAVATPAGNTANTTALANEGLGVNKPAGGFSDVEPAIMPVSLGGGAAETGAVGTADAANFGQGFGVVVSRPLYRAMQVAQGIAANTDTLDPTFDPANAPSITKAQYATIIAQGAAYQTDWSPIVGAAGAGKKVILARRVNSSGTQSSSNAYFLKSPCSTAVQGNLNPASAADSSPTFEVFEGAGTGNVKTRITTATTAGDFAIGVVSLENDWRVDGSTQNGYRFVSIGGVHPEAGDVANARATTTAVKYDFHMESYKYTANTVTAAMGGTFAAGVVNAIDAALIAPPSAASCTVFPRGLTLSPLAGSICAVGAQVINGTNLGNSCAPIQMAQ